MQEALIICGDVAQMVERSLCMREARERHQLKGYPLLYLLFQFIVRDPEQRRAVSIGHPRPRVQLKVLYCGICHSDLHAVKNDWGSSQYPLVPGHEMVGKNYCPKLTLTYNRIQPDDTVTYGGYSDVMVVDEDFVIRWPEDFPMDKGAPLLCAGITTYSPMKYYGIDKPGLHIGVVGLGGLGHVAAKFAKAFGSKVTVISTSVGKKKEAMESLSADGFVISRKLQEMQAAAGTLHGIIDTVSAVHALAPLLSLLKPHGKLIVVGAPEKPLELSAFSITLERKSVAGSIIGGLKETQDMIDFAGKHNIVL
ncbi:UNVERIFIED_CONTAM: 8-hydroxygeraniol dehydrogenase [Sesamum calycinum]|uniref:8-hydroxygeraniol dehydrogenase n=1 Tax=Sesamum calycinum TaxID=2727403 RepID=A0AAW2JCL2_9LAMI